MRCIFLHKLYHRIDSLTKTGSTRVLEPSELDAFTDICLRETHTFHFKKECQSTLIGQVVLSRKL